MCHYSNYVRVSECYEINILIGKIYVSILLRRTSFVNVYTDTHTYIDVTYIITSTTSASPFGLTYSLNPPRPPAFTVEPACPDDEIQFRSKRVLPARRRDVLLQPLTVLPYRITTMSVYDGAYSTIAMATCGRRFQLGSIEVCHLSTD